MIEIKDLIKEFKVPEKREGLGASLRSFFKREYREVKAVKGISFEVEAGEKIGFIGSNGAGKTTTLKMLSGLLHPTSGYLEVLGYNPWDRKNDFLRKISLVMGQRNQLWWDIPAYDSFVLNRDIYGIPDKEFRLKVEELSELLDVVRLLKTPVRNLSLGERMKMEIIGALLHSPEVLFLDEPTIGLDMISQKKLRSFIDDYNKRYGTTILLTSHYLADITTLCERVIVITGGTIVYDGSIDSLQKLTDADKLIRVEFSERPDPKALMALDVQIKEEKNNEYLFKVRSDMVPDLMAAFSNLRPLDMRVLDQSIEDIIEDIYKGTGVGVEV